MRINFLTIEEFSTLKDIQKHFSKLTFQNNGYEYIDKSKLSELELQQIVTIEKILSRAVVGFERFFNFKINKNSEVEVRFNYNYGAADDSRSFSGVGYVTLRELREGFDN